MKLARPTFPTLVLSVAGLLGAAAVLADPPEHHEGQDVHGGPHQGPQDHPHGGQAYQHPEAHGGPQGYQRVEPPRGWDNRPQQADPHVYNHNYQSARVYHIGPYRRPAGWVQHHWAYGQILPRVYWDARYLIADYWLFALEVPPAGCEWVRDDADALLISTATGQILQVMYGVFG